MVRNQLIRQHYYTAEFEPAEGGGFVVTFPALPGLFTGGDTLEDAQAMAADVLRAYLASLAHDGTKEPDGGEPIIIF
jgi:antitoxin HicB